MYVVADIETTGLNPRWERITEIALYVYDGEKIIDSFTSLINPERLISPQITALTGITNNMLENAPRFFEIAKKIVQLTENKIFVGHNVHFDYNFIRAEFQNLGYEFTRKTLCTIKLAKKLMPGLKSYGLGSLCQHLGIANTHRHRASGDAFATTLLFEKLIRLEGNNGESFSEMSAIPFKDLHPELKRSTIEDLPTESGVYYLFNDKNELIYIGKSLNIQKRIIQHLQKSNNISMNEMRQHIVEITYELTGSELIALLLESAEIKKHKPLFNRQQKRTLFTNGIYFNFDKNGYINFFIDKNRKNDIPLMVFSSKLSAKGYMENIQHRYDLCQKLCGLYNNHGSCFEYTINRCKGACLQLESAEEYNKRAGAAIESLDNSGDNYFIIDKGRKANERAVISVKSGKYTGFGYIDTDTFSGELSELDECIKYQDDNRDVQLIIRQFLRNKKVESVVRY